MSATVVLSIIKLYFGNLMPRREKHFHQIHRKTEVVSRKLQEYGAHSVSAVSHLDLAQGYYAIT
ncbi:MAG: hypothetical protein HRU22_07170 [Gammaproteobacteria bacterium]|nr:hypothetical protein [Gammaproteobacteria bacterium]